MIMISIGIAVVLVSIISLRDIKHNAVSYPRYTYLNSTPVIDGIEKTHKLFGISACIINSDGSITLMDAAENALWIPGVSGGRLESMTLRPGEACRLIDGHHISISYKFLGLRNNEIDIEVIDKFDARAFGSDIKQAKKEVVIFSYDDRIVK